MHLAGKGQFNSKGKDKLRGIFSVSENKLMKITRRDFPLLQKLNPELMSKNAWFHMKHASSKTNPFFFCVHRSYHPCVSNFWIKTPHNSNKYPTMQKKTWTFWNPCKVLRWDRCMLPFAAPAFVQEEEFSQKTSEKFHWPVSTGCNSSKKESRKPGGLILILCSFPWFVRDVKPNMYV